MNKKVLLLMLGALLVAIMAASAVNRSLTAKKHQLEQAAMNVEIMIANKYLEKGALLSEKDVTWKAFPQSTVYSGMIKKPKDGAQVEPKVFGKAMLRDVNSGEPVTEQAVLVDIENYSTNLSSKLEAGMRAVGVNVKANTAAGGFVAPGDHVDVILTYPVKLDGNVAKYGDGVVQKFASETVLHNVRVLAVDQVAKESGYQPKIAKTVTLEVDATGAQIAAVAEKIGEISLALRRVGEVDTAVKTPTADPSTDVNSSKLIKGLYEKMKHDHGDTSSVRVYSGDQVLDMPMNNKVGE